MKNKTDEVVQFTYLDSIDREVRRQCIKKYGKEVEQFGECDEKEKWSDQFDLSFVFVYEPNPVMKKK